MQKLKRIFSPNTTSPATEDSERKSQKYKTFRRTNSGSSVLDASKKKKDVGGSHSYRSGAHRSLQPPPRSDSDDSMINPGTLHLDINASRNSNGSNKNELISQFNNSPSGPHPTTTTYLKPNNESSLSTTASNKIEVSQSPTTRQNEADEFIQKAIQYHEANELEKATYYFKLAADKDSPLGLFLYGISLRHGWGCKPNVKLAVRYLQRAAESAVSDLHTSVAANPSIARHELVLAIYELGVCFRHGWGVPKNKQSAAYYFEIAANLGDPDAQNDIGFCYYRGEGVKKDMKKAARYYRMAAAQGSGILGNSWIFKTKYDE
ncbi:6939_t:CDS:2 [Acaulospora morrowiae]|uniref:6939_t:CDS:1 n=1 Tax=Acaulospora morrowiae TaxID=94023 RepID=A0A9N9HYF0_9GLOM|nr:6939_t:CDS:2 [Acaulospora morrowiae]